MPKEGGALQRLKKDQDGFISLILTEKIKITHDTYIFRFGFPDPEMTFGMPIGNHVMFKAKINGQDEYRKYTPITDVSRKSFVDFVIKIYRANVHPKFPQGGKMTQYLENLVVCDVLQLSGPKGKYNYLGYGDFTESGKQLKRKTHIGHLAGGTGITPCFHVLQSSLRNKDGVQHSMLFGNRTVDDILLHEELQELAEQHKDQFKIHFTVDIAPGPEANWTQSVGFMTKDMIKAHMPPPGEGTIILFCGPPPFVDMLKKVLPEMGYTKEMMLEY